LELILENEFFRIYREPRLGKTFKVIEGEEAPVEIREINMWKNRQKTPENFNVVIVKGTDGTVYNYEISRASAGTAQPAAPTTDNAAPAESSAPAPKKPEASAAPAKPAPSAAKPAAPASNRIDPDKKPTARKSSKSIASVTTTIGTAPTDRVKFEEAESINVVVENEFCKIYKNTRSGKTFKVINGMIAPIELRELNMWKNRQKNPGSFTVEIMKDEAGTPFDYIISRINEDGTLTKAPAVAPYAPYIPPENEYIPTTLNSELQSKKTEPVKPAQVYPVGKPNGALPAKEAKEKIDAVIDRIAFEETPSMSLVVDNEFFKIYNDFRRGKTFKVIDGKILPIELRELNLWKNRQKKPKNYAVEIVKTKSGEIYDYRISRTKNSTTAAVESTSTKTNMPPVNESSSASASKKRRPNSDRVLKCAICGNEFAESKLLLFDNRNFCSECVESLIKAKLDFKPVDPIQRVIDDVVAADELYCTYSTVTNYPYLDEDFCVNVCTVKKAAEIMEEDIAVQTIDDKGIFFDDLKRFGLKKIIVNGDTSNIFEPEDFDKHVKTEGVIAPKLYFKILNFMQRKDDDLREKIAASFIESKIYTFALNDEITEITEENIEDFKPLIITDGHAKFCPVFTDFSEAKSVGMPFRGLYEIDADLLSKFDITHYIINPASLGFIMNKSILKPFIDDEEPEVEKEAVSELPVEEEKPEELSAEPIADVQVSDIEEKVSEPEIPAQPVEPIQRIEPIQRVESVQPVVPPMPSAAEVVSEPAPVPPVAEQLFSQPIPAAPVASQLYSQPAPQAAPVANQFYSQPAPAAPAAVPTQRLQPAPAPVQPPVTNNRKRVVDSSDIVIKSNNTDGSKKALKVSMPVFIPDDPNADIDTTMTEPSALQKAINKSKAMFDENSGAFSASASSFAPKSIDEPAAVPAPPTMNNASVSGRFSFNDFMNDDSSSGGGLDLSSVLGQSMEEPAPTVKPKLSIQHQATEAKVIARDLEVEPDVRVAQILRDQLNESYRKLAKMISEAEVMYAEFDSNTKHILIDGNNKGHIFSEKTYADKSVENFAKNGINVFIKEYKNEELFNMLFEYKRHGIQDLVLDETANWVIISTDTISSMLDIDERKFVPIPVSNPELMFSMTTLFQKLQSKSDNPKRKQEVQSLEKLMIREFTTARYILPLVVYNGTEVKPISIDSKNGVKRVLVFSDSFEMKRFFGDKINIVKDYEIVTYRELIKKYTVMANTVVVLNEGSLRFEFNDHNCEHINKVMAQ